MALTSRWEKLYQQARLDRDKYSDPFLVPELAMWLTDGNWVAFVNLCREQLKYKGVIFVKDDILLSGQGNKTFFQPKEQSIARPIRHFGELFQQGWLRIDFSQGQPKWSVDEFTLLYIFVLKPDYSGAQHCGCAFHCGFPKISDIGNLSFSLRSLQ
jgi:hypothetical protein